MATVPRCGNGSKHLCRRSENAPSYCATNTKDLPQHFVFFLNNSNGDLLQFVCSEASLHTNGKDCKFSRHNIRQRVNGKSINAEHFSLISSECSALADDTARLKEEMAGIFTILRQHTKWFCAINPISSTQKVSAKSKVSVANRQCRCRLQIANDSSWSG